MPGSKVTPFIWYNTEAEEAAKFYVSLIPNSKITNVVAGPGGGPLVVNFQLDGVDYTALNGGPQFALNEAFSLTLHCDNQAEIDFYWDKLSEGGKTIQCGWLQDRFGLFWQINPKVLAQYMADPDPAVALRVMQAVWQMTKLDIAGLQQAFNG